MPPLIGHSELAAHVRTLVRCDALGHAYLFVGPQSVGKTTFARWLAQLLLCGWPEIDRRPCGRCDACVAVDRGVHPDVFRYDATTDGVDAIRAWRESLLRSSLFGGWKMGIVEDGGMLRDAAANAMLKVLEEPPPRTLMIITAASRTHVLPTIASRCAILRFHRVPDGEIEHELVSRGTPAESAAQYVAAAAGCPGRALAWVSDVTTWTTSVERTALVESLFRGTFTERLAVASRYLASLSDDRSTAHRALTETIEACGSYARKLVRTASSAQPVDRSYLQWLRILSTGTADLRSNVSPRLLFDAIICTSPSSV